MHAIVVTDDNGLVWREVPDPRLDEDEALVEVHATALNRADLSQRAGRYPPPPGASDILGLELAGVVRDVRGDGAGFAPGDRVCALLAGGGYAELAAVPSRMLMPVPAGWSFEQAAGMPEVFFTAFLNLFLEAGLQPGERVLIHGGASGVGTAAIQLAVHAGAEVIVTASSEVKRGRCRELGAALAIDYTREDFAERIRQHSGDRSVQVILDMVGAPYLERHLKLLDTGGRLVFISTLGGRKAELDIRTLMARRATLKGSTLRSRPLDEKIGIRNAFAERFWPALESGEIAPVIDRVVPVDRAEAAHAAMAANETIGKVILKVR